MMNAYCIYARCPAELAELLRSRGIAITYVGRSHVYVRTALGETQLLSIIATADAFTQHTITRRAK